MTTDDHDVAPDDRFSSVGQRLDAGAFQMERRG